MRRVSLVLLALVLLLAGASLAYADLGSPETTIESGPAGPTNDPSPSFGFSSDDPTATFQCRLAQPEADFAPCGDPKAYSGLDEGTYTFFVRAVDAVGTDPTPAERTFTVDRTPPGATIVDGPEGLWNSRDVSFDFTTPGADKVECQLDGKGYEPCDGSKAYSNLSETTHVFEVRSTDAAGNETTDSRSFTVDVTAPDTKITSGPADGGATRESRPTFGFESNDGGATFKCWVDSEPPADCSGSFTTGALTEASHRVQVQAFDAAGNRDGSPAVRRFTVDRSAPSLTLSGTSGWTRDTTPNLTYSAEPGARVTCSLNGKGHSCSNPDGLGPLPDAAYTFAVRGTDAAGNTSAASRSFVVDTKAPAKTSILIYPNALTRDNRPVFGFTSNDNSAVYDCSLDSGAWKRCGLVGPLKDGRHSLRARARDAAGNVDGLPPKWIFRVDRAAPRLVLGASAKRRARTLRERVACPRTEKAGPCRGTLVARRGGRVIGRKAFRIGAGRTGTVVVGLKRSLPARARVALAAAVKDALGNARTVRKTVRAR